MIFYTINLDENNNRVKGTGKLLGKTSDEGTFYPDGCFVETYLRIKNKEKSSKVVDIDNITSREIFKNFEKYNRPLTKEEILYIHTGRPQTYNLDIFERVCMSKMFKNGGS